MCSVSVKYTHTNNDKQLDNVRKRMSVLCDEINYMLNSLLLTAINFVRPDLHPLLRPVVGL